MIECLDLRPDQPRPQGALEVGREKGCLPPISFNRRRLLACVQTSPLPQDKSGEETSVNRRR